MAMQQCPNGHLYDDTKNNACPFCGGGASVNATVPLGNEGAAAPAPIGVTVPLDGFAGDFVAPQPDVQDFPSTTPLEPQMGVTVELDNNVKYNGEEIYKVRGWLICLEGQKMGMDYKIYSGNNTIGRGATNRIVIDFDTAIGKGVNAIIAYDIRNNKFFMFQSGEAKNSIYVNGGLLMTPVELKDYDIIEIGKSKFVFRSLCNENFNWPEAKEEDKE